MENIEDMEDPHEKFSYSLSIELVDMFNDKIQEYMKDKEVTEGDMASIVGVVSITIVCNLYRVLMLNVSSSAYPTIKDTYKNFLLKNISKRISHINEINEFNSMNQNIEDLVNKISAKERLH